MLANLAFPFSSLIFWRCTIFNRVVVGAVLGVALCSSIASASGEQLAQTVFINVNGVALQAELSVNRQLIDKIEHPVELGQAQFYRGSFTGHPQSSVRVTRVGTRWRGMAVLDGAMYRIGDDTGVEVATEGLSSEPVSFGDSERQLCGATRYAGEQAHAAGRGMVQRSDGFAFSPIAALHGGDEFTIDIDGEASMISAITSAAVASDICANPIDGVCLLPEIEFAYDLSYQNLPANGQTPTQRALGEINELEMFLERSFNFRFSRLSLTMLNSAQDALIGNDNSAGALLDRLRSLRGSGQLDFLQKPRSIFHFVTGRNFPATSAEGNIVGLAYLQQACAGSGLNSGLTDAGDTPVVSLVMAHEIGHNLGASHDDAATNGCAANQHIMSGSIGAASGSITDFSSCSVDAMTNEIAANLSTSCFAFPVDVIVSESEGNPLQPPIATPFTTAIDVTRNDGFVPVAQLRVAGAVADPSQGYINGASIAGGNCTVASDRSSFVCSNSEPATTTRVQVTTFVYAEASEFSLQVDAASTTGGTQEMLPADNQLTVVYSDFSEAVELPPETGAVTDDTNTNPVAAKPSSGGGGSVGIVGLALLIGSGMRRIMGWALLARLPRGRPQ